MHTLLLLTPQLHYRLRQLLGAVATAAAASAGALSAHGSGDTVRVELLGMLL